MMLASMAEREQIRMGFECKGTHSPAICQRIPRIFSRKMRRTEIFFLLLQADTYTFLQEMGEIFLINKKGCSQ
jgi:hypothetical protein